MEMARKYKGLQPLGYLYPIILGLSKESILLSIS
ncbi:MAG: hypothetical protein K0S24_753 [Sphingobacterium sp.]|jgi:hypothetical protein|nr:hypothetical protein [Sphingobacterium sp.]